MTPGGQLDQNIDSALLQYFNHDLILLPFFFDEVEHMSEGDDPNEEKGWDKRSVLVSVKVLDN